jgi:hypothetical protein
MFVSNDWLHLTNEQRNQQQLTLNFNETHGFFSNTNDNTSSVYLRIGLNRDVYGRQTGIGLCSANLTFIECLADPGKIVSRQTSCTRSMNKLWFDLFSNLESAMNIHVHNKTFEQHDLDHIHWISHLNYLDPNADIRECTAQGQ